MDLTEKAPDWARRPLPVNSTVDESLLRQLDSLSQELPESLETISRELDKVQLTTDYDAAVNRVGLHVWREVEKFYASEDPRARLSLLNFVTAHLGEEAQAKVCRRLAKDSSWRVRYATRRIIERVGFQEVALPLTADSAWDATGWLHGTINRPMSRHKQGRRVLDEKSLPRIDNLGQLRELIGIKSRRQLGYLLLASDQNDGPYTRFTIAKRGGGERVICAPKKQLRWVQRQILDKILDQIPAHDAAHGFVTGRSTVTNAAPHRGAKLLIKFDLCDFFPTIRYHPVMGLFTSLGYYLGDGKFGTEDDSNRVAPTLARLCCYSPKPESWENVVLPQGAPTSPAVTNLVCRRLDARMTGLAARTQGVYTRYADDLTFSFREKTPNLGRFRWWVDQICLQEGFHLNRKKHRVIRTSQRQLVTGIVVNDELRLPRELRRGFRAVLHNCRRHGVESQARDRTNFEAWLRGFASYLHMVSPDEGSEYLKQVEELLGSESPETEESP